MRSCSLRVTLLYAGNKYVVDNCPAGKPINCTKLFVTPLTAQASRMADMMSTPTVPSTTTGPVQNR